MDRIETPQRRRSPGASKLTNGSSLHLPDHERDGRSTTSRRWRDLYQQRLAEVAAGPVAINDEVRARARRLTSLQLALEQLDAMIANGTADAKQLDLYSRMTGQMERALRLWQHSTKQVPEGTTLATYCATMGYSADDREARAADDEDEEALPRSRRRRIRSRDDD